MGATNLPCRRSVAAAIPVALSMFATLASSAFLEGCEGCLQLDQYTIVPEGGSAGTGGAGGSGGRGGAGGSAPACAPGAFSGNVFASFVSGPSASPLSGLGGACSGSPDSAQPGIDVIALDPATGACRGRAHLLAGAGSSFDSAPRIQYAADGIVVVAGALHSGSLEFPPSCDKGASVLIIKEPTAFDSIFVGRLQLQGSSFCTAWTRRLWTLDPPGAQALALGSVVLGADGGVGLAGGTGGARIRVEDVAATADLAGGPFVVTWSSGGTLSTRGAVDSADTGAVLTALSGAGLSWLATGTMRREDPVCNGCTGQSLVVRAARVCPAQDADDAGGADVLGDASVGDDASSDAIAVDGAPEEDVADGSEEADADAAVTDVTARPAHDLRNAVLFSPQTGGCGKLATFGSDEAESRAQIGFGVASLSRTCGAYWTGLTGPEGWPLSDSAPGVRIPLGQYRGPGGFLVRFSGGAAVGCTGAGAALGLRLESDGRVMGDHVASEQCDDGATLSAFVREAADDQLNLRWCPVSGGACTSALGVAALGPDVPDRMVVMDLSSVGQLRWYGAFGPVRAGADTLAGTLLGRPETDLALDALDHAYVVLRSAGPLQTYNVELLGCDDVLDAGALGGTFVIQLVRGGFGDKASCGWAERVGD